MGNLRSQGDHDVQMWGFILMFIFMWLLVLFFMVVAAVITADALIELVRFLISKL